MVRTTYDTNTHYNDGLEDVQESAVPIDPHNLLVTLHEANNTVSVVVLGFSDPKLNASHTHEFPIVIPYDDNHFNMTTGEFQKQERRMQYWSSADVMTLCNSDNTIVKLYVEFPMYFFDVEPTLTWDEVPKTATRQTYTVIRKNNSTTFVLPQQMVVDLNKIYYCDQNLQPSQ